jgi:beta-xylosidase
MTNTPVIPGYHPDPSICRVGSDYFLATSSFEYSPGVPLFTSTDLRSWHQLGNVLDRESQLTVRTGVDGASGGVYAPTLRHHDGRFWLTTTNVDGMVNIIDVKTRAVVQKVPVPKAHGIGAVPIAGGP